VPLINIVDQLIVEHRAVVLVLQIHVVSFNQEQVCNPIISIVCLCLRCVCVCAFVHEYDCHSSHSSNVCSLFQFVVLVCLWLCRYVLS
jgi:hypothetical protein